jgi:hypothetical protein
MTQAIDVSGLRIFAKTTPCAHSCRYCLVGRKKVTNIDFPRFAQVVERFLDWRNSLREPRPKILVGFEDSYEFDVATLKGLFDLYAKSGWTAAERNSVKLGGLERRTKSDMQAWLAARRDDANLRIVHASLAGCDEVHDRWNGRRGDFELLVQAMTAATELGLRVHQRLFVVESTLPVAERLLDRLDAIPCNALRYLSTFVYQGNAVRLENERITERTRDHLPDRLAQIELRHGTQWLSEREWIRASERDCTLEQPKQITLDLEITEGNLAVLENSPCDEIYDALSRSAQKAHALLPPRGALMRQYGDRDNHRIYASLEELERKWLDRHFSDSSPLPLSSAGTAAARPGPGVAWR